MMVMTAKLNFKKLMMILSILAAVILSVILFMGESKGSQPASAPSMAENQQRVNFLRDMGWEVESQPIQSGAVKMPRQTSPVYERYNNLQKSQGYDLNDYAGKKAMRYVYQVKNPDGSVSPMTATLLVYEDKVIGGDITDTGTGGKIRGLRKTAQSTPVLPQPSEEVTLPTETAPLSTVPRELPQ